MKLENLEKTRDGFMKKHGIMNRIIMLVEVIYVFATWLAIAIIGILIYFALIISYENRIDL